MANVEVTDCWSVSKWSVAGLHFLCKFSGFVFKSAKLRHSAPKIGNSQHFLPFLKYSKISNNSQFPKSVECSASNVRKALNFISFQWMDAATEFSTLNTTPRMFVSCNSRVHSLSATRYSLIFDLVSFLVIIFFTVNEFYRRFRGFSVCISVGY